MAGVAISALALPAHKSAAARGAIKAKGARLPFLPPYSPDFNPIVNAFAKLKALLRKAAVRNIDDLSRAIDTFTPAEHVNDFAIAGYGQVAITALVA